MIRYDRLWATMEACGMTQYRLIKQHGFSAGQIGRLKKNMHVSTHTLDTLCTILNCGICDIIEFIPEGAAFEGGGVSAGLSLDGRSLDISSLNGPSLDSPSKPDSAIPDSYTVKEDDIVKDTTPASKQKKSDSSKSEKPKKAGKSKKGEKKAAKEGKKGKDGKKNK